MRIADLEFEPFLDQSEIESAIEKVAGDVAKDYEHKTPLFVGVLNGSFRFVSEFIKHYPHSCEVSFVKLSSYQGLSSTGIVETLLDVSESVEGRDIVVLEDIIDSGRTLQELIHLFSTQNISSFAIATLFFKPSKYKKEYQINYKAIDLPDEFVVGYGLDYKEKGRELNDLYILKNS
jgi:adenylate kinase